MKKKIVSLLTVMALAATTLAGCGSSSSDTAADTADSTDAAATEEAGDTDTAEASTAGLKAGFIFLHDENSTYDLNFMNAAKAACEKMGVEYVAKTNIPKDRSATMQPASLQMQDVISFLQTALDMRIM